MSEFDRDDFDEIPLDEAELPPVPPEFEEALADAERRTPTPVERGPADMIAAEERNWAVGAHLSAFLTFIVPIPGASVIAPFIVWQMKKDSMPYVAYHGAEAVNFNLSWFIWLIGAVIIGLAMFVVGLLITVPIVGFAWLVLTITAAVKAANGEYYRYPLTIRFVK